MISYLANPARFERFAKYGRADSRALLRSHQKPA